MKIIVDRAKCTGLGLCESIAPDIFEVDDSGDLIPLHEQVPEDQRADVEAAISACPTAALRLEY
ncbi:ferredoxin [Nocardia fluminea]|uniref:ferredoxin n=1 Tax=Nocardia fluminea TaxID=134984 RepID=UPI003807ECB4